MGLLGWIIVAIVIGGIIKAIKKARKQREEKQRLLSIPCGFNDGISQEQFSMIAKKAAGDVDRISETTVDAHNSFYISYIIKNAGDMRSRIDCTFDCN